MNRGLRNRLRPGTLPTMWSSGILRKESGVNKTNGQILYEELFPSRCWATAHQSVYEYAAQERGAE